MSGDGHQQQEKVGGRANEKRDYDDDDEGIPSHSSHSRRQRPTTARQRNVPPSASQGAVGGEGFHERYLTEEQRLIGNQAQYLLGMFISDRAKRDNLPSQHVDIVNQAVPHSNTSNSYSGESSQNTQSNDNLREVGLALRGIGDQLSQDYELNSLIDMVVVQSPREIFMKVCKQLFADGQFNWGRVVAVFYFAYRLIIKAVSVTLDKGIPWIKEIFSWSMEFLYEYVIWWIVQRGGWLVNATKVVMLQLTDFKKFSLPTEAGMIKEYFGPSTTTVATVGVAALLTVLYVWWKQQ